MPATSGPGLVYYMLDATRAAQYLKIGFTTNLKQRQATLAGMCGSGQLPTVLALEEGDAAKERERHEAFAELRSHGEWFHYEHGLRVLVGTMEHPFGYILDRPHLWRFAGGWGPLGSVASTQRPYFRTVDAAFAEDVDDGDEVQIAPTDF